MWYNNREKFSECEVQQWEYFLIQIILIFIMPSIILSYMLRWYDGYCLDDISIYNPKSVVESILRNNFGNYWTKTETYEALKVYIQINFDGLRDKVIN